MEEDEWEKIYNCNIKSVYLFVKHGLELLKKSKNQNVINIGSVHGTNTSDQIAGYGSSKAAIIDLTRNLAIELGQFNIRVNCISPGAIDTPMLRQGLTRCHVGKGSEQDSVDNLADKHILKRIGYPKEIADIVHYITQKNMTGSNVVVDGGTTIKLSTE